MLTPVPCNTERCFRVPDVTCATGFFREERRRNEREKDEDDDLDLEEGNENDTSGAAGVALGNSTDAQSDIVGEEKRRNFGVYRIKLSPKHQRKTLQIHKKRCWANVLIHDDFLLMAAVFLH